MTISPPSASGRPPLRRRRYLIDRGLQIAIVLEIWIYLAAYTALLLALMLYPALKAALSPDTDGHRQFQAAQQLFFANGWMVPATLTVFAILGLVAIVWSNRLAGPIYRLKLITRQVGEGDLSVRIRLRERDYLQDFREIYNQTLSTLSTKLQAAQNLSKVLVDEAVALSGRLQDGKTSANDAATAAKLLAAKQEELDRALSAFKT
ncbi:MAG: hypothetical protein HYT87_01725 [Nitrospirae bacterium]|nr:hypothetical protein [Nitrospirota bacterium]